ncbi:rRNA-processing protein las1 [Oleoguttula sp. CCFEE 5521]
MAWKLRCNLPHAVESTALLVDAFLHHALPLNSPFSIRAVYGAAFTRFVTGFCDIGRNRERVLEPSSMLEIARQIGMPAEFVALRHEATHEDLPSVQRLVAACEQALEWLWDVYWSKIGEGAVVVAKQVEAVDVNHVKVEARRIFRDFRGVRRTALKKQGPHSQEARSVVTEAATNLQSLCSDRAEATEAAVAVLVADELLYPSERELGAPLGGAFMIWDDLLIDITDTSQSTLRLLTKTMFARMSAPALANKTDDIGSDALLIWLAHVASAEAWQAVRDAVSIDVRTDVMRECCLQPGHWSYLLGTALLKCSRDDMFIEAWSDLLQASAVNIDGVDTDVDTHDVPTGISSLMEVDVEAGSFAEASDLATSWQGALFAPRAAIGVVR